MEAQTPPTPPPPPPASPSQAEPYPLTFAVDYPDRPLSRLSTFFRLFAAIPIAILASTLTGGSWNWSGAGGDSYTVAVGGVAGLLFIPPLLMLLFRKKYPLWWATWNREFLRFTNRIGIYISLMDDRYPSTDEQQSVRLDFPDPDGSGLSRGLPLIKWLLAIPHYIILLFLYIGAFFAIVFAWFAILFTARYPQSLFNFVEGVYRWHNRVVAYAFILITDRYPPFHLSP